MGGLSFAVEMVNTSYIQLWHGEIDHLVQHWNSFGRRMVNMLFEKVRQRSNYLAKLFRSVLSTGLLTSFSICGLHS